MNVGNGIQITYRQFKEIIYICDCLVYNCYLIICYILLINGLILGLIKKNLYYIHVAIFNHTKNYSANYKIKIIANK